jgi:cytochrome c peroxidase
VVTCCLTTKGKAFFFSFGIVKKAGIISLFILVASSFCLIKEKEQSHYSAFYARSINEFEKQQYILLNKIKINTLSSEKDINDIKGEIELTRLKLKNIDFWLRYFEPVAYKKINGPLPVEWENEVFEKFEKPYKRTGAGLSLAELYLNEKNVNKDSLVHLIQLSADALNTFRADSITRQLDTPDHFFLCNRLYLLNLAAIYTTGFECPGNANIIPELRSMVARTRDMYIVFNQSFPQAQITNEYLGLYDKMVDFVNHQPDNFEQFDYFIFIKNYVNPLFAINQKMINQYGVVSNSFNDYTLNNNCNSIFDKSLYTPQNSKGIYSLVTDTAVLSEIRAVGKLLFYDPILSGNNERTCASCHKPKQYFTDTSSATSLKFDQKNRLPRNTPTLINVIYNHLLMLDGKHISLQNQGKDVITNPEEMGGNEREIIKKVLSCQEYKNAFKKFLRYTPEEKEVTLDHIISAITMYYSGFSNYYSPFDDAMNNNAPLDEDAIKGFNLFMSKGQCATCHYVPQFNGVPPPYISSEFEVIGVPEDTAYTRLSSDEGRYKINPAAETMHAFRTGSLRNNSYTKPYMHNGVFNTLDEVIDFYDAGGGTGKKLNVENQTLSSDSLKLTLTEKKDLILFIRSLNEKVIFENPPEKLPLSSNEELNIRKVGGVY